MNAEQSCLHLLPMTSPVQRAHRKGRTRVVHTPHPKISGSCRRLAVRMPGEGMVVHSYDPESINGRELKFLAPATPPRMEKKQPASARMSSTESAVRTKSDRVVASLAHLAHVVSSQNRRETERSTRTTRATIDLRERQRTFPVLFGNR